jgi:hypothetical protein
MTARRGMWCERCAGPVAGRKATHRARNTALTVLALPTYGVSLLGARIEGFHCPHCGGPVGSATSADHGMVAFAERPRVRSDWTPAPHQSGDAAPAGNGWEAGQTVRRSPRAPREKGPLG